MKTMKEIRQAFIEIANGGNRDCPYLSQEQMARRVGLNPKNYRERKQLQNFIHRSKKEYEKTSRAFHRKIESIFFDIGKRGSPDELFKFKHNLILQTMFAKGEVLVVEGYVNPTYDVYMKYCQKVVDNNCKSIDNKIDSSQYTGVPSLMAVMDRTQKLGQKYAGELTGGV